MKTNTKNVHYRHYNMFVYMLANMLNCSVTCQKCSKFTFPHKFLGTDLPPEAQWCHPPNQLRLLSYNL